MLDNIRPFVYQSLFSYSRFSNYPLIKQTFFVRIFPVDFSIKEQMNTQLVWLYFAKWKSNILHDKINQHCQGELNRIENSSDLAPSFLSFAATTTENYNENEEKHQQRLGSLSLSLAFFFSLSLHFPPPSPSPPSLIKRRPYVHIQIQIKWIVTLPMRLVYASTVSH